MKKLVLKSITLSALLLVFGMFISGLIAQIINYFYWDVPSSWIYGLTGPQCRAYITTCCIGNMLVWQLVAVARIKEWIRLHKDN